MDQFLLCKGRCPAYQIPLFIEEKGAGAGSEEIVQLLQKLSANELFDGFLVVHLEGLIQSGYDSRRCRRAILGASLQTLAEQPPTNCAWGDASLAVRPAARRPSRARAWLAGAGRSAEILVSSSVMCMLPFPVARMRARAPGRRAADDAGRREGLHGPCFPFTA